eukprot:2024119-Alexandrium_andersonii.AAC.1
MTAEALSSIHPPPQSTPRQTGQQSSAGPLSSLSPSTEIAPERWVAPEGMVECRGGLRRRATRCEA